MSHIITFTCDSCGKSETYPGSNWTTDEVETNLIRAHHWQKVTYGACPHSNGRHDQEYEIINELRCPKCALTPAIEDRA